MPVDAVEAVEFSVRPVYSYPSAGRSIIYQPSSCGRRGRRRPEGTPTPPPGPPAAGGVGVLLSDTADISRCIVDVYWASDLSIVKFLGHGSQIRQDPAYFNHWTQPIRTKQSPCRSTMRTDRSAVHSRKSNIQSPYSGRGVIWRITINNIAYNVEFELK